MIWVIVVGALALAGAVIVALYAYSLTHQVADVKAEAEQLQVRNQELRSLLGRLELPSTRRD